MLYWSVYMPGFKCFLVLYLELLQSCCYSKVIKGSISAEALGEH